MVEDNKSVLSFKQAQLQKMAKTFVDIYEDPKGGMAGATGYARQHIGKENYKDLRPYVQKEFADRGYTVVMNTQYE